MTQEERLIELRAWVELKGKVTLTEVCEHFDISRDSARRDLVKLSQQLGIQRIRGGAMLVPIRGKSAPYSNRPVNDIKHQLAHAAVSLLDEKDHVSIDTSTTLALMPQYVCEKLVAVTNGIDFVNAAAKNSLVDVHLLGGHFDPYARAILGSQAEQQMKRYHVNKAFIGVCALSSRGLTTDSELEASMKRTMLGQAQQVILVCESSKMGCDKFHHVCNLSDIDVVVTDHPPQPEFEQLFDLHDIQCIVVTPK